MRSGAWMLNSPGSCPVSRLERLADRPGAERNKIVNFAASTKMSLASMAGTEGFECISLQRVSVGNCEHSFSLPDLAAVPGRLRVVVQQYSMTPRSARPESHWSANMV